MPDDGLSRASLPQAAGFARSPIEQGRGGLSCPKRLDPAKAIVEAMMIERRIALPRRVLQKPAPRLVRARDSSAPKPKTPFQSLPNPSLSFLPSAKDGLSRGAQAQDAGERRAEVGGGRRRAASRGGGAMKRNENAHAVWFNISRTKRRWQEKRTPGQIRAPLVVMAAPGLGSEGCPRPSTPAGKKVEMPRVSLQPCRPLGV
jgi:hypothetical protein